MATKSPHKLTPSKANKAKQALAQATKRVAEKGVFVVVKNALGYDLLNIVTNTVVLTGMPTRKIADSAAKTFNGNRKTHADKFYQKQIDQARPRISQLKYEIDSYTHILNTVPDSCHLYDRRSESELALREIYHKLHTKFSAWSDK